MSATGVAATVFGSLGVITSGTGLTGGATSTGVATTSGSGMIGLGSAGLLTGVAAGFTSLTGAVLLVAAITASLLLELISSTSTRPLPCSISLSSVSYTHLDVYKRQVAYRAIYIQSIDQGRGK